MPLNEVIVCYCDLGTEKVNFMHFYKSDGTKRILSLQGQNNLKVFLFICKYTYSPKDH